MNVIRYTMLLLLLAGSSALYAQDKPAESTEVKKKITYHFHFYTTPKPGKGYITAGGNGPLLSFASMKNNGEHIRNIPRFTMFFNVGTNYNYDFTNNIGIFTGLNIKNIGLISKPNDSVKLKQRVYTLGVPLGLKVGDIRNGYFFFFGGEYDLAFNYKEKYFLDGHKKSKFNEWFSDRTPLLMPSVFAGVRFQPGFGVKVQYYLNDFFNKDYSQTVNGVKTQPYKDMEAKMLFVTLSYNFGTHRSCHYERSTKKYRGGGSKLIIEKRTVIDKE